MELMEIPLFSRSLKLTAILFTSINGKTKKKYMIRRKSENKSIITMTHHTHFLKNNNNIYVLNL